MLKLFNSVSREHSGKRVKTILRRSPEKVVASFGYSGRMVRIDLETCRSSIEPLSYGTARKYIGGLGLGIWLLINNSKPGCHPLSPENPIILTVGPLGGTIFPTGGNGHVFTSKSPLTNCLGESKSRGFFGSEIKRAGYDAILFENRAKKPVYVLIDDDSVVCLDARHLWGRSPREVEDIIKKELRDDSIRVASIGVAGEKLSPVACIMNDRTRAAGRTGMGAVMGSKNLKAIAVCGTKDITVAHPERLFDSVKSIHDKMKGSAASKYRNLGTTQNVLVHNALGALPTRNFTNAVFDGAEKVSGEYLNERFVVKTIGCSSCAMRCEHIACVPDGPYQGTISRVEYEPVWAFGPHCGVDRIDAIIKSLELCNYYGLDSISTGNIIGFAMDCYESRILSIEETDGLDLCFGNAEAMVEMVHNIGKRQGLGDILAEGVKNAAAIIGRGAEKKANHIKGLEMTGYDIRGLKTAAIGYAVSFRGADHNRHGAYAYDLGGEVDRFKVDRGRSKLVTAREDLYAVIDSLILCKFSRGVYMDHFEDLAHFYSTITGIGMSAEDFRKAGERINNLARIFNIREGFGRKEDHLPAKVMTTPIPDNTVSEGSYITQRELDFMLDDYYVCRGWTGDGVPTREKLKELGLDDFEHIVKEKAEKEICKA